MKIAMTLERAEAESPLDRHFGRCRAFAIYETGSAELRIVDNTQNFQAAQGAGIQAAQNVLREGVEAVITGSVGPKAFRVLSAAGVRIYQAPEAATVLTAVEAHEAQTLEEIHQPNGVPPLG